MKRIFVPTDVRVVKRRGLYFSLHSSVSSKSLERFCLPGFETILVARLSDAPAHSGQVMYPLPAFVTIMPLASRPGIRKSVYDVLQSLARLRMDSADIVVARIPELLGSMVWLKGRFSQSAVISHLVAAPDVVARRVAAPLLRPSAAVFVRAAIRHIVRHSTAAVFLTEQALRSARGSSPAISRVVPNVVISEKMQSCRPSSPREVPRTQVRLVSVGHFRDEGKGFDALLETVHGLRRKGIDVYVTAVGTGQLLAALQKRAQAILPQGTFEFPGELSHDDVTRTLNKAHLYVSCSRSEAHGRAIIEAMYLGLPVAAFGVGGIPDYLPSHYLASVEDTDGLASIIQWLATDPVEYASASRYSLATSQKAVDASSPSAWHRLLREVIRG